MCSPTIVAAHHEQVLLRKRGLESHEVEDLLQEVFLALHNHILENGFVDNIPGMLHTLTEQKVINHVRAQKRSPFSIGMPSSGDGAHRGRLRREGGRGAAVRWEHGGRGARAVSPALAGSVCVAARGVFVFVLAGAVGGDSAPVPRDERGGAQGA
jgi:hypothetical protein